MKFRTPLAIVFTTMFLPVAFPEAPVETIPPLIARPSVPSEDAPVDYEREEPVFNPWLRSSHPAAQHGAVWVSQGPGPTNNGQVENIFPNDEVVGAVHVVLPHPVDPNTVYIGAVNGGIWKTENATHAQPTWVSLVDDQESLNIGAMEFDPADPTWKTIVAGTGRFSSFGSDGGGLTGILRTTDGGATWTALDGGGILRGKNISAIAARANVIVVSADYATSSLISDMGIFRSTDSGATFTLISGSNGLPSGRVFDIVSHRNTPEFFYAAVHFAGTGDGIYKSADYGLNWVRISNATMDSIIRDVDGSPPDPSTSATSNIEMSIHDNGVTNAVYVAILNGGQLRNGGIFRSATGGITWTAMETPSTNENGSPIGTNPRFKPGSGVPGGQGAIHFDIEADPFDPFTVYVGGDRQPAGNEAELEAGTATFAIFPNSIGATNYTGRLFRGDASQAIGSQWEHLTHSPTLGVPGGGTLSASAPHADCRDMAFRADGVLVEGDDGGVYVRTSPQDNQGDWLSINGTVQTTEFHDIAYDPVSNIILGGAQDTGTPQQRFPNNPSWNSVSTADGGDVAVDYQSFSGFAWRYSSFQFLGDFRRQLYDGGNNLIFNVPVDLAVGAGEEVPLVGFVTPFELNAVNPQRLIIGAANGVFESLNQGDFLTRVVNISVNEDALAYGGRSLGANNEAVIYAGSGSTMYIRMASGGALSASATPFPGGTIRDIVLDPDAWQAAFVIDSDQVFLTPDAGGTWTDITGNLTGVGLLRTLAYIPSIGPNVLIAGTDFGVFFSRDDTGFLTWAELGTNLPGAPVMDAEYVLKDDMLVVGTLGRGAWTVPGASFVVSDGILVDPIWVDFSFAGLETGTETNPFNTLQEGVDAVEIPRTPINIAAGQSSETLTISTPVTLNAVGGTVRIGAP